jgi:magnesium transporter
MKGIVTADDNVDVEQEEATEDMHKIGGMQALDAPYLDIGTGGLVRKRAPWLAALLVGETITASAMGFYEHQLEKAAVLMLFLPLIISSGGNSGSQASTLVIRSMALGEVALSNWWRILRREVIVGFSLGGILGAIGLVRVLIWGSLGFHGEHYVLVGATVAVALVGVVLWGSVTGSMLPFILRRLGLDPASASAPFVATMVDVTGILIYFEVASAMLRGSLL